MIVRRFLRGSGRSVGRAAGGQRCDAEAEGALAAAELAWHWEQREDVAEAEGVFSRRN
jgi:hypothetical protein